MDFLKYYLISCVVVYIYLCIKNPISFKDVSAMDIFRGIVATLIWPIALAVLHYPPKDKVLNVLLIVFEQLCNIILLIIALTILAWSIFGGTLNIGNDTVKITLNGLIKIGGK